MSKKRDYVLTCKQCGKQFHHTTPNKVYCSDECKQESKKKICPICGKPFIQTAPANKYCSDECYKQAKYDLLKQRVIEESKIEFTGEEGVDYVECKICGQRMSQFHVAHLEMHGVTKEEYEAKYGKMQHFCSKHIEECFCGENNPNHSSKVDEQTRKERSPFSKEFYKARDLSEKDREAFHKQVAENRSYNTRLSYYTDLGYDEDTAREMLAERQRTYKGGSYSKSAEELINLVLEDKIDDPKFLHGHNEKRFSYDDNGVTKYFRYDLTNEETKRIIEFNGDFWHGNPEKYDPQDINTITGQTYESISERDAFKQQIAVNNGYSVIVIWESDFKKNKDSIVETCKKFIL